MERTVHDEMGREMTLEERSVMGETREKRGNIRGIDLLREVAISSKVDLQPPSFICISVSATTPLKLHLIGSSDTRHQEPPSGGSSSFPVTM